MIRGKYLGSVGQEAEAKRRDKGFSRVMLQTLSVLALKAV